MNTAENLPTLTEYKVIEEVYTFYPSISCTKGKYQVAWLYRSLGMSVFYDMLVRSRQSAELEKEIMDKQSALNEAVSRKEQLKRGPLLHGTDSEYQKKEVKEDVCNGS